MIEKIKPMDIEKRSFEIITEILGDTRLDPENELVIKRVIHTTADFEYVQNLVFSDHAVQKGIEALKNGCDIVTDTQMAKSGINKTILGKLGGQVHCFMSDADVAADAKERGITRSTATRSAATTASSATAAPSAAVRRKRCILSASAALPAIWSARSTDSITASALRRRTASSTACK